MFYNGVNTLKVSPVVDDWHTEVQVWVAAYVLINCALESFEFQTTSRGQWKTNMKIQRSSVAMLQVWIMYFASG